VDEGTVTINFFGSGSAEKAVVKMADEDGDEVSVLLYPLTGRVKIQNGDFRHAQEFVSEDATGNEVRP